MMNQREEILNYFRILKKQAAVGPAYLFCGEGFSVVSDIVKTINCQQDAGFCGECWDCRKIEELNHPDLFILEAEGLTTKIEAVREGIRFLSLKSFRAQKKVIIIKDGLSLSLEAANAFLKTLEEPPGNSFIGVCATRTDGILPTIISRCRKIALPCDEESPSLQEFGPVVDFLQGRRTQFKDRRQFSDFLWEFILFLRNELIVQSAGQPGGHLSGEHSKFLHRYAPQELAGILREALKIYAVRSNVNINLALNLLRTKFVN